MEIFAELNTISSTSVRPLPNAYSINTIHTQADVQIKTISIRPYSIAVRPIPDACSTTQALQRATGGNALRQLNASERSLVLRNGIDKQESK